jgi:hypothetical protein
MFRTFATMPATMPTAAPASESTSGGETEAVRITGVSAITTAVENRLKEAEMAACVKAETATAETLAVEAPAEAMAAISSTASPVVDGIGPEVAPEKLAAEQKASPAQVAEEAPAEEAASATFADAVGKDEIEATAEQNEEPVSATAAATAEENRDLSSDGEGEEDMGKDAKSKSGKSNWHQIRTAPASTASANDVVEAAKQGEHAAEEAPKAMAAAAASEGGSAPVSVTDASTIASIVDSVMADLRPRIVEEIARKLAGK